LRFAVPDGHRITRVAGLEWTQRHQTVIINADRPLPAGATATVSVRGTFRPTGDGVPGEFTVNGVECERAVTRVQTSATPAPTPAESTRRRADAGGSGGGGTSAAARTGKAATPTATSAPTVPPTTTGPSPTHSRQPTSAAPTSPPPIQESGTPLPTDPEPTRPTTPTPDQEPDSNASPTLTPTGNAASDRAVALRAALRRFAA
jgi:hypothetical protein